MATSVVGVSGTAQTSRFDLVVIVGSLGGLEAVATVLSELPRGFAPHVAVLLHGRRREAPDVLPLLLQRRTPLPVRTGESGAHLVGPGVTVVPRGRSAHIGPDYELTVGDADPRGSGDALMSSAAEAGGRAVIGAVLTGMLADGAQGVRAIKSRGGRVLVQDPDSARAGGMPSAAIATGCIDFVLPLNRIAAGLVALAMAPGAAELLAVPTPSWARLHA